MAIVVGEAACSVLEEIPFYQWLYRKLGLSSGDLQAGYVPVFSKKEIWEYEAETGSPYFMSPRIPVEPDKQLVISTSGTTSRTLPVPIIDSRGRGAERAHESLGMALSEILGAKPVMWIQPELSPAIRSIVDQNAQYSGAEYRFISCRLPIQAQLEQAKTYGCSVLIDLTGLIAPQIVQNSLSPRTYGIRAMTCAYQPETIVEYLRARGVETVFYFTAADSVVLHVGCPHCASNAFHIRTTLSHHEVYGEDGSVKFLGSGLYVSTIPSLPFPLVRYTNGDLVLIETVNCRCGFEGTNLVFQGRVSHVKLGNTGPLLNYEEIYKHYSLQAANMGVSILFGALESSIHQQRFYVFLERSVEQPTVIQGAWQEVMTVGAGGPDTNFAQHVHVVEVPVGSIGHPHQHKRRIFVDLSRSEGPLVEQLVRLAYEATGEKLKVK